MAKNRKPAGYWDIKENCITEAKNYKTKMDFCRGNQNAYIHARKHGWLDECGFLSEFEARSASRKGKGKWNKETCYEAAKQCSSKKEFDEKFGGAYSKALKEGWIPTYNWFRTPEKVKHTANDYVIYAYIDEETHSVYVGLTCKLKRRHRMHRNGKLEHGVRKYDTLKKFFMNQGKELPMPKIHMTDLSAEDAQYYEDWYKCRYAELGWNVINKGKTGVGVSAIGGTYEKYTDEELIAEANKYDTSADFRHADKKMWKSFRNYPFVCCEST